jgi:hypothetical protein
MCSTASFYQDWKSPRTARGFTGHQGNQNGQVTVLRCITNTIIPCTADKFAEMGKTRFNVTVVGVATVGRASAPNKKQAGKYLKQPNTKQLFEPIQNEHSLSGVRMFAFRKANSNTDRGDRDDDISAVLTVGQVLTFWVHDFMYQARESIKKDSRGGDGGRKDAEPQTCFPSGIQTIPEFTIVDMHIMTSHNGNLEKGYGINLKKVALHPTTLYSYLTDASLHSIPSSYASSIDTAVAHSRESPFIHNQLEVKDTAFFCNVPPNAFISSQPVCEGVYRLVGHGASELFPGVPCVDIRAADLVRFANLSSSAEPSEDLVTDAITFFDFASAAGALHIYVVSVPSFKSRDPALGDFLGVPVIDSDQFLRSVDFGGSGEAGGAEEGEVLDDKAVFPFRHPIVDLSDRPLVTVLTAPVFNASGPPAPCPDFALMSEMCSVSKGYLVMIGTEDAPEILRFVFNVMGCQFSPNGQPSRLNYLARLGKRKEIEGASGSPEDGGE